MLFYFLLQRRMISSIVTAIAVISVKEDAPIAAAMVAIVAGVETWISSPGRTCAFSFQLACGDHTYPVGFCNRPFADNLVVATADDVRSSLA
jgi:hypothetical protein